MDKSMTVKRMTLLMLLIALLIISGCIDNTQSEVKSPSEEAGWNQTKYEEYSKFYELLINGTCRTLSCSKVQFQSLAFEIEDKLAEMPSNKSEFEKTWRLAFSNYQHGLEALTNAYGTGCSPADFQGIYTTYPNVREKRQICRTDYVIGSQNAQTYFDKSYEYRQNIEEWNPHAPKSKGVTLNAGQQNFSTIQAAINAANAGDVILVGEGNYPEKLLIKKSGISIIGKNKEKVIIENNGIRIESVNNVLISGFTIQRFEGVEGDKDHFGVSLLSANNNTITNINIINKPVGIALSSSHNNSISGTDIKSSSRYGIHISQSNDNKIYSNNIQNNKVGIYEQISQGNKIFSNNFVANEDDGKWEILASPPEQKTFNNSIGMEFVQIPAGTFNMGKPLELGTKNNDDVPSHFVNISKTFYMSKYEVTQKQWNDIMGNNPSFFRGDNLPVEQVSWNDVQEFVEKLNEKEGTNKYRLPSEAEWEWASYSIQKLDEFAWYSENSDGKTHPVGQKKPNSKGLYDMIGNVWEWVQDSWHKSYFGAPSDGSVWDGNSSFRVVRGCSWKNFDDRCYSGKRGYENIETRNNYIGFRLVLDL